MITFLRIDSGIDGNVITRLFCIDFGIDGSVPHDFVIRYPFWILCFGRKFPVSDLISPRRRFVHVCADTVAYFNGPHMQVAFWE